MKSSPAQESADGDKTQAGQMGRPGEHEVPTEYQDGTQQPPVPDEEGPPQRHKPGLDAPDATPHHMEVGEGNLLELPDGAAFGAEQPPSAQEREHLLRQAAQAKQEMQDSVENEDPPALNTQ